MKCTKCGSDAVMKDGDWLTCLNCGNVMFDTRRPEETAAEISPTKLLEHRKKRRLCAAPARRKSASPAAKPRLPRTRRRKRTRSRILWTLCCPL